MKFHHYGHNVYNLEEWLEFFQKQLGFKEETRFAFMEEEIVFLTLDDFRIELVSSTQENGLNAHICFEVNNLNDAMNDFKEFRLLEGPYKIDNGWQTVFYEGPNHAIVELLQMKKLEENFTMKSKV